MGISSGGKPSNRTTTNDLTNAIIRSLFAIRVFAFRQNVLPIPMVVSGQVVGYRPPPVTGIPDVQAIVPSGVSSLWPSGSGCLFIEVKTGRDQLRPSQLSFHANARAGGGAIILVVKTYADYLIQLFSTFNLLTVAQKEKLISYDPDRLKIKVQPPTISTTA